MICKTLQKYIAEQKRFNNTLGFIATNESKKDIADVIKVMKTLPTYKYEKISNKLGTFYGYTAVVNDSLFPYTVKIFYLDSHSEMFGSKNFFRVEIL